MKALVAALNYLAPGPARVRTYAYDPPDGAPRFDGRLEAHAMAIADARAAAPGLAGSGFTLCPHRSAVRDFWDPAQLLKTAYPEADV
ncbi:MAG: methyltransferase, partial [Burkholderiales bacterium]|nr:methyltransferase [Burkholderiales bacterium]